MTGLRIWFDGRSLREKRMLLVMVALLALTIIWGLIIRPIGDGLSSARERQASAAIRLGQTQGRIAALHDVQANRVQPLPGTLADAVRALADQAGFALAGLDPSGPDRVRVSIASARPGALVAWLGRIESAGVLVDTATLRDNGDHTVAASLVLKARAR